MRKHTNNNEIYIDGSKTNEKKLGFAAMFLDTKKTFIHTGIKQPRRKPAIRWTYKQGLYIQTHRVTTLYKLLLGN